ncbi:MAG: hypothetical protein WCP46_05660 [Alphaproteobacteria bacterium]
MPPLADSVVVYFNDEPSIALGSFMSFTWLPLCTSTVDVSSSVNLIIDLGLSSASAAR